MESNTIYWIVVAASILADIVTGLLKAFYTKSFKSSVMRQGLFHKLGELLAVGILYGAQTALPMIGVDAHLPLFTVGCGYCVLMELGSIIENLRSFTPGLDNILGRGKNGNTGTT